MTVTPTSPPSVPVAPPGVRTATVATSVRGRARAIATQRAIVDGDCTLTYAQLWDRVQRLAAWLHAQGVGHGDRVAVLSENRHEYLQVVLAAGHLGAIVACQNWRLAPAELDHCVGLVTPVLVFTSERFAASVPASIDRVMIFGAAFEAALAAADVATLPDTLVDAEDPLLILYTSGTTGLPKGAVISHRAQIVRNLVSRAEYGIDRHDAFVAWSPMYHMGGMEYSLGALMGGGTVFVVDGFDADRLVQLLRTEPLGWLLLMPGMVAELAARLAREQVVPRSVKLCGVMADLVAPEAIAAITTRLGAPYANTFGATETGNPPCSTNVVPVGVAPTRLSKEVSPYCEIRLCDATGRDVADGEPGELWIRGPTLFSGYWANAAATAEAFADGWFHMGDVFVRNPDGTVDFVDRVKYLIKSGGENIYPAEIERVIREVPGVTEVAVVRRPDPKWGEVPVAFVATDDAAVTAEVVRTACRAALAGYKQPKGIEFIALDEFPRSASGKIQRQGLEPRARTSAPEPT